MLVYKIAFCSFLSNDNIYIFLLENESDTDAILKHRLYYNSKIQTKMPRSKDSLIWSLKTIILLSLTILLSRSQSGCTGANVSNILGCISCDTTENEKVYNRSSMKFTCINSTLNCTEILTNSNCSICKVGFVLQNGLCNPPPDNLSGCLRTEELNTSRCV